MRRRAMVRRLAALGAMAVLVGVAAVGQGQASAATNTPLDCDGVVAVTGGYRLTHDSICGPFRMTGNDEFFDLGGHTLTGSFRAQGDREVLRNGTLIQSAESSAEFTDGFTLSHVTLRVAVVSPPKPSIWLEAGSNFTVMHSKFVDIPGIALDFYFNTGGSIRRSSFTGNGYAISIQKSNDVVIQDNRFVDNQRGVNLRDEDGVGVNGNTILHNTFRGNDYGVYVEVRDTGFVSTAVSNNTIRRNRFVNNGYSGIRITDTCEGPVQAVVCTSSAGNLIADNIFSGNGLRTPERLPDNDGVTARAYLAGNGTDLLSYPAGLAGFTLTHNRADHNADLGFDVLGVVDGGRNVANGNGNSSQCDGLACRTRHGREPGATDGLSRAGLLVALGTTYSHH